MLKKKKQKSADVVANPIDYNGLCGAVDQRNQARCVQPIGHVGVHANGKGYVWKDPKDAKAKPATKKPPSAAMRGQLKRNAKIESEAATLADACSETMGGIACTLAKAHDGNHVGKGGTWTRDRKSARFDCAPEHDEREDDDAPEVIAIGFVELSEVEAAPDVPITRIRFDQDDEDDDPLEDEVRSDADRDLARKQREAREAHARELSEETTATDGNGAQGDPASVDDAADGDGVVDMKQTAGCHLSSVKIHPAADVFPMLEGEEYDALREDIRKNGVRVRPVLDADGLLVDGRNRLRACDEIGIDVVFDRLPAGTDVIDFVISANLRRRHLNASQRSMFAEAIADLKPGRPKETGSTAGLTQAQAAQRFGVSERSIREARVVRENAAPEVVGAVHQGKLSVDAAARLAKLPHAKQRDIYEREIKPKKTMVKGGKIKALTQQEEKRAVVRKINEQRVAPMPAGEFGVIYGDYPWPFENSDQHDGSRGHMAYPPMPMDDILEHAREARRRAAKHCVVALWFVNAFLHEIGRVLEAYGATMRTAYTWDKSTKNDKDKAGVGTWGRPRTEHLVIASIGEPTHTLNEAGTLIRAVIREPGRKPDEFAELLRKHCGGPFLELFAREPREGWASWGAETDKFATEAA